MHLLARLSRPPSESRSSSQMSPVGKVLYRASLQGTCAPVTGEDEKLATEKFNQVGACRRRLLHRAA